MKTFTEFLNETKPTYWHEYRVNSIAKHPDHGWTHSVAFHGFDKKEDAEAHFNKMKEKHPNLIHHIQKGPGVGDIVKKHEPKDVHSSYGLKESAPVGERKHEYPHSVLVYDKDGSLHHIAQFKDLHGAASHYSKQVKAHGKKRKVSMITTTAKQNNVVHIHAIHKPGDKVVESFSNSDAQELQNILDEATELQVGHNVVATDKGGTVNGKVHSFIKSKDSKQIIGVNVTPHGKAAWQAFHPTHVKKIDEIAIVPSTAGASAAAAKRAEDKKKSAKVLLKKQKDKLNK